MPWSTRTQRTGRPECPGWSEGPGQWSLVSQRAHTSVVPTLSWKKKFRYQRNTSYCETARQHAGVLRHTTVQPAAACVRPCHVPLGGGRWLLGPCRCGDRMDCAASDRSSSVQRDRGERPAVPPPPVRPAPGCYRPLRCPRCFYPPVTAAGRADIRV